MGLRSWWGSLSFLKMASCDDYAVEMVGRANGSREWRNRLSMFPSNSPQWAWNRAKFRLRALHLTESTRERDLTGGETAGIRALESFTSTRGHRYHREMSSPNTAYESCSRLSPYLAWGCLSMRSVVQAIRMAAGDSMPKIAARAFLSRCHWHCHFMQKLESEPEIEFEPLIRLAIAFAKRTRYSGYSRGRKVRLGIPLSTPVSVR